MWSNAETGAQNQVVLVWTYVETHLETTAPCLFRAVVVTAIITGPDGQTDDKFETLGWSLSRSRGHNIQSPDSWLQHWAKVEGRRSPGKHLAIEENGLFPESLHLLLFCDVLELLLGPSLTSGLSSTCVSVDCWVTTVQTAPSSSPPPLRAPARVALILQRNVSSFIFSPLWWATSVNSIFFWRFSLRGSYFLLSSRAASVTVSSFMVWTWAMVPHRLLWRALMSCWSFWVSCSLKWLTSWWSLPSVVWSSVTSFWSCSLTVTRALHPGSASLPFQTKQRNKDASH